MELRSASHLITVSVLVFAEIRQWTSSGSMTNWKFRISPGGKLYLENLSNCKVLSKNNDILEVQSKSDTTRQGWFVQEVEQVNWYDDLYFRFYNDNDISEDKVMDASIGSAMINPRENSSQNQKFVLEEALDVASRCDESRQSGITPFFGARKPNCGTRKAPCAITGRCRRLYR